jgi:hypothetical protein
VSPGLASTGTAPLEFAAVAVFDDHIVPGERVAKLTESKLYGGDRTLQTVMAGVAASLSNAS